MSRRLINEVLIAGNNLGGLQPSGFMESGGNRAETIYRFLRQNTRGPQGPKVAARLQVQRPPTIC